MLWDGTYGFSSLSEKTRKSNHLQTQHRGLRPLLFSNGSVGSFTSHKNQISVSAVRRDLRFSSLSEKTRKSNRLQMSLQRQHFLLSYLKTLSVGPAGIRTRDLPLSRPALSQLS